MPQTPGLKALVASLPGPDQRGQFGTVDKAQVEQTIAALHAGGRDTVLGLIDLLVEPGKGDDIKPHYALHALAVHVTALDDDAPRAAFAATVAQQLLGKPPGVQRTLCRVLQVAGGKECAPALGKLLLDEPLCEPAAQALAAIGAGAAEQLAAALPKAKGSCRRTLVQSLGFVRGKQAAAALRAAIADPDREVRTAATWALANIGDASAADAILTTADAAKGWERMQHTKACFRLADALADADRKPDAARIHTHLRDSRTDPAEKHVRSAAIQALAEGK